MKKKQVVIEFDLETEKSESILETIIDDLIRRKVGGEKVIVRIYSK